ncbi:MAG: single-stranded DNA-binding protein [Candidatus Pacebacteria bacterium]|jgi:single-strand DNA-binding protein|nr:single-stranded DNA-binding protein [Candidatus Paceibacterota bacterium]
MNLNKVFILGRLTQDPQARSLPSGDTVANFGIATNRIFYNKNKEKQEQTEFHNVVLFGKIADIAQQYLKQGAMVLIEGRLQTRSWEDKDGMKKYKTEIIGENLQMGPRMQQGEQNIQQKKPAQKEENQENIPTIEEEIDVKDLPL